MSGTAQATLSNLNLTTARYLLGNCKTVFERWTSETLKTLVCDSVQRLCVVFLDMARNLLLSFFFVYFQNDLGNGFHEGTGRSVQTYSSLSVPEAVLCGLDGPSWSQLFRLLRTLGPLSCLFPSWAPFPVLTSSRTPPPTLSRVDSICQCQSLCSFLIFDLLRRIWAKTVNTIFLSLFSHLPLLQGNDTAGCDSIVLEPYLSEL